jgi:two-component system cell cycle response regulator
MTEAPARILVVDDNRSNVALAVYLLRAFGCETAFAYDGAAGLAALRERKYDAVLVDLLMPGMDGYEFARRVRTEFASAIPLVAVTALAMAGDRERVLAGGFDGYIAKPIDPATFAGEVASLLRGHSERSIAKGDA